MSLPSPPSASPPPASSPVPPASSPTAADLYKLIIRQLRDDGFQEQATAIAQAAGVAEDPSLPPQQLASIVQSASSAMDSSSGLRDEEEVLDSGELSSILGSSVPSSSAGVVSAFASVTGPRVSRPQCPSFLSRYAINHKDISRIACFSRDGRLLCTGSGDGTVKVMDVAKVEQCAASDRAPSAPVPPEEHPNLRMYTEHSSPINDLDFHPTSAYVCSCAKERRILFFDITKSQMRRPAKIIEVEDEKQVRSVHFHPSGDYLLMGGYYPLFRLYDLAKFVPFVTAVVDKSHQSPLNMVRWAPSASFFVTCSKDGSIKSWDAKTGRCLLTIGNAHSGEEVSSISFDNESKLFLSSGKDNTCRLWNASTGQQMKVYTGAKLHRMRSVCSFSYDQQFVLCSDEDSYNVIVWDLVSGDLVRSLPGHSRPVRAVVSSPSEMVFVSAGEDRKTRFWNAP